MSGVWWRGELVLAVDDDGSAASDQALCVGELCGDTAVFGGALLCG